MLIGVDARELEGKPTGVGVYLRNILERIALPKDTELLLYFRNLIPKNLPACGAPVLLQADGGNLRWQQWTLARELNRRKVRLFFSPANTAPWSYRGISVMTVHDLSFFRHPEWFSRKERLSRKFNTRRSLRRAARVYAVSAPARDELAAQFPAISTALLVTPNGVAARSPDPERREALRREHGMQGSRLILFAGSLFNRRHLPELIEAVANLDASCRLVIIGENRTHPYQDLQALIGKLGVSDRVTLLDYANDQALEDHYRMADLFVYLSEYEGFGIPPLEAMSYGVPCVVSSTPHMDRIFESAATFVKTFAPDEIRSAIQRCLADGPERERLTLAGTALARRYSWEETARIVSEDWARLLYNGGV